MSSTTPTQNIYTYYSETSLISDLTNLNISAEKMEYFENHTIPVVNRLTNLFNKVIGQWETLKEIENSFRIANPIIDINSKYYQQQHFMCSSTDQLEFEMAIQQLLELRQRYTPDYTSLNEAASIYAGTNTFQLVLSQFSNDHITRLFFETVSEGFIDLTKTILAYNDPIAATPLQFNIESTYQIILKLERNSEFDLLEILWDDPRFNLEFNHFFFRNQWFAKALERNKVSTIKKFTEDPRFDPTIDNHRAFLIACDRGNLELVKHFLKDVRVNPSVQNNKALVLATTRGNFDIAQEILKDSRFQLNNISPELVKAFEKATYVAIQSGNKELLELLQPYLKDMIKLANKLL
ncbi:MAG: hypothetical protein K0S74_1525 [Chlamydiales bacterium]|jgi:hypothetical protein|nr:hypothetical protein [Chlamydiales bacterium]